MHPVRPVRGSRHKALQLVLFLDALVFFGAALFNVGAAVPLGFTTLRFDDPIWQAAAGETVIGTVLLAAGLAGGRRLTWIALVMSTLGIAVGLSSDRVHGAARELHVVLIAFAVLLLALLADGRRKRRAGTGRTRSTGDRQ